ncbi:hypothetical protein [Cupriavidus sp. TMH.W2]|uniref:hypothetical protein n=1 Tax=Cupriavidus sp. TMH.W2 TaxID=3434465 RepID=UPI003D78816D
MAFVLVGGGWASGGSVGVPTGYPYAYRYTSRMGFGGGNIEYVLFGNIPYDQLQASGGYNALLQGMTAASNPGSSTVQNGWTITHGTPSMQVPLVTGPGFDSNLTGGGSNGPGTCFIWTYTDPARVCNTGSNVQ